MPFQQPCRAEDTSHSIAVLRGSPQTDRSAGWLCRSSKSLSVPQSRAVVAWQAQATAIGDGVHIMHRVRSGGVLACGVLAVSLGACTASEPNANSGRTVSPLVRPTPSGCVDTAGLMKATDGVISAGPFKANRGHWRAKQGTKLWVATSVNQKRTTAVIRAQRLDSSMQPIVTRRHLIATPEGDPPGLFFPGLLRLPRHGIWQITVTIGNDSGCFRVDV